MPEDFFTHFWQESPNTLISTDSCYFVLGFNQNLFKWRKSQPATAHPDWYFQLQLLLKPLPVCSCVKVCACSLCRPKWKKRQHHSQKYLKIGVLILLPPSCLQGSVHHFTALQAAGLLCGFSLSKMCVKHWHWWCHSYLYSLMTQALEKSCWNYMFHSFNFPLLTREWFALSCLSSSLPQPGSVARFPCWVSQAKLPFFFPFFILASSQISWFSVFLSKILSGKLYLFIL